MLREINMQHINHKSVPPIINIRPEEKLLFTLARQHFQDVHHKAVIDICSSEKIRWENVYLIAVRHQVAPLIYVNLMKCTCIINTIPSDIMKKFQLYCARSIRIYTYREEKIQEILSYSKRNAIDVMMIKGSALAVLVYDHPWYTTPNDVDLIIKHRKENTTEPNKKEMRSIIRGILHCECDYFAHADTLVRGVLEIDFRKIWHDAV